MEEKVVVPPAEPLTLDEFCIRLSRDDSRVEMIGAFASAERAAGRLKDFGAEYASRFTDFCRLPA